MNNQNRIGFFTSSQASRLTGFEKRKMRKSELENFKLENPKSRITTCEIDGLSSKGHTYVEEVFLETLMGRSISTDVKTKPMKWGNLMEVVLFNLLGLGYKMTHKQTIKHHSKEFENIWSGTPDLIAEGIKIGEIKCYEPKKFALLSVCLLKRNVQFFKEQFPDEYWQCVSNAILCKLKVAEIIVYMPYRSELETIIEKIIETNFLEMNGLNPQDYYFMSRDEIDSLPHLPDDSKMSNINSFEFDIPQADIDHLTNQMRTAKEELELKKAA